MLLHILRKKFVRSIVQGLFLAVFLVGIASYTTANKAVSLTVNGETQRIHTFSQNVGDVLKAADVLVSSEDKIFPDPEVVVSSGDNIVVNHSKIVELQVDGIVQQVQTNENTVHELLQAEDLKVDKAFVSQDLEAKISNEGFSLAVSQSKTVKVVTPENEHVIETNSNTVSEVFYDLASQDILDIDAINTADPAVHYQTFMPQDGLIVDNSVIRVFAVATSPEVEIEATDIPFTSTIVESDDLYKGEKKVQQKGLSGSKEVSYSNLYLDGTFISKSVLSENVVKDPVEEITLVGMKQKPAGSGQVYDITSDISTLNWAALAKCEAGGNPATNTGNGYYGLYQFNAGTWAGVGGVGIPSDASAEEQTMRAQKLFESRQHHPWPHCGPLLYN